MKKIPIAIFAYNRFEHFERTVNSLIDCDLSENAIVYLFLDGPINNYDLIQQNKIIKYFNDIKSFKDKYTIYRSKNYGLRDNIISGINYVLEKYDYIIVIEDDLILDKNFLYFMCSCLEYYKNNENIWHVNGWSHPIISKENIYLHWKMNCWGWGTWKNRWTKISINAREIINETSFELIKKINMNGYSSNFSQVTSNYFGRKKTWAIFWQIAIIRNNGLCVSPATSLVDNIGFDDSGCNSKSNDHIYSFEYNLKQLRPYKYIRYYPFTLDDQVNNNMNEYYKKNRIGILKKFFHSIELILAKIHIKYENILR